jgi:SAM-dependent methyltransferase
MAEIGIDTSLTLREYFGHRQNLPDAVRQHLDEASGNAGFRLAEYFGRGCRLPHEVWEWLNRDAVFDDPLLSRFVAPFPPTHLMENVSGLISESGFASHGADFWEVLSKLSPKPLDRFESVLDFGCGCGRLARMFLGHPGEVSGCDIDAQHIAWIRENLTYCSGYLTKPDALLPFYDGAFEFIVSVSIFTHLSESSQDLLLKELRRIAKDNAVLLLTIHGERALERALTEPKIWEMIAVDKDRFEDARESFQKGQYGFILQHGHLTTDTYDYGISFAPKSYIDARWGELFNVEMHASGALHDWQDVIVLRPKKQ